MSVFIKRLFFACVIIAAALMVCMNGSGLGLLLVLAAVVIPHRFRLRWFLPMLFILSAAVHLAAVYAIEPAPVSDFARMVDAAQQAAAGDFSFQNLPYYFQWAYQTGFVLWEALLLRLFGSMASIKIANALLLSGINCLIYLFARRFAGEQAAQSAALLYLATAFPTLLTCVLTNQHVSAFFFLLALYVLTGGKAFSLPRALAAGVLLAAGNILRPEGIVILAALCGTVVFALIMRRSLRGSRRILCGTAAVLAVYAAVSAGASWAVSASGVNRYGLSNNWPEWKFIVGFNHETNGWYSAEDRARFDEAHQSDTPAEITEQSREEEKQLIRERILCAPPDFFRLMSGKLYGLWIANGLGFPLGHLNSPEVRVCGIRGSVIYQYAAALDRTVFAAAALLALFGAMALMRRKPEEQEISAVLPPMTVLAFFAVFLLVEVQPRYVFLPQIFLYLVAAAGICAVHGRLCSGGSRRQSDGSENDGARV